LGDAERAGTAWRKFLDDPGAVVIGATQGASCFGAAYEFLFNTSHQLRKAKLHDKVSLTFITAEPFVGHFGIGGLPGGEKLLNMFLKKEGITARTGVAFEEVTGDRIKLTDGTAVPFRYAMVVPPFAGQEVVRATPGLSVCRRHRRAGAGALADIGADRDPQDRLPHRVDGKVAARNIAAAIKGEPPVKHKDFAEMAAVCMMDAGSNGVMILADHMLPRARPRS
jgi:hypothetical protein